MLEPVCVTVGDAVPESLPVAEKLVDGVCEVVIKGVAPNDSGGDGDDDTVIEGVNEAETVPEAVGV